MKKSMVLALMIGAALSAASFVHVSDQEASSVITSKLPPDALHEVMQGIYDADKNFSPTDHRIGAVIVPHHLTASDSIATGIRSISLQKPKTILLLSPDHFHQCPTLLCITDASFQTLLGKVDVDLSFVRSLSRETRVTKTSDVFTDEHGIGAVLPYIHHYLPNTKVVPVLLSQKRSWKTHQEELQQALGKLLNEETVLVVSSDFSHYLRLAEADKKDEETAKVLFAGDLEGIANLQNPEQSDCPGCLWILASLAQKNHFYNPSILMHTNAARLLNEENVAQTTSHFSMVWYQNDSLNADDAAFGGDVTITRLPAAPKLSKALQEFWEGSGLRMVNLEGPLSDSCRGNSNPFMFCNPLSVFQQIAGLATHWGIPNNHMFDRGVEGVELTEKLLKDANEIPVSGLTEWEDIRLFPITQVVNPVAGIPHKYLASEYQSTVDNLRKANNEKLNVVYLHYGTEYQALVSDADRTLLRSFIDAGADVVIGLHSHVQSDMEIYQGKPILYGIGNFLFDQKDSVATSMAKVVRVRKEGEKVRFETGLFQ